MWYLIPIDTYGKGYRTLKPCGRGGEFRIYAANLGSRLSIGQRACWTLSANRRSWPNWTRFGPCESSLGLGITGPISNPGGVLVPRLVLRRHTRIHRVLLPNTPESSTCLFHEILSLTFQRVSASPHFSKDGFMSFQLVECLGFDGYSLFQQIENHLADGVDLIGVGMG